jgi:hypothetical protein
MQLEIKKLMHNKTVVYRSTYSKQAERLIYLLVFMLIYEGVLRKLFHPLSLILFFLKDIFCLYGLYLINQVKLGGWEKKVFKIWQYTFIAFLPCLFVTFSHDPLLAIFGLKQYLLYVVTGILVPIAFPPDFFNQFKKAIVFFCLMLVPTTLVAVIQNSLPGSHWLNQSVDGTSLEGFSAAGKLRVSSTFAFTGQYSFFLNCVSVFWAGSFFLYADFKTTLYKKIKKILPFIVGIAFLIGVFITGGRTAVFGSALCLGIGLILLMIKQPQIFVKKGLIAIGVLCIALSILRTINKDYFAAFDTRSTSNENYSQSKDFQGRFETNFIGWTKFFDQQDLLTNIFGNGLGVMSNGSEKISSYAHNVIAAGAATEADMETTVWEGGIYLLLVYYLFRILVILFAVKVLMSIRGGGLISASVFLLGLIIVSGIISALGRQPPIAIWWWMTIGSLITIGNYSQYCRKINNNY